MTLASDQARLGDTRREADHAAEDLTHRIEPRSHPGLSRLAWRRHRYWILAILGLLLGGEGGGSNLRHSVISRPSWACEPG